MAGSQLPGRVDTADDRDLNMAAAEVLTSRRGPRSCEHLMEVSVLCSEDETERVGDEMGHVGTEEVHFEHGKGAR